MKKNKIKLVSYTPPTISRTICVFLFIAIGYLLIFFIAWPDTRFSEQERNHLGRWGTLLVYFATLLTMLSLMHDSRVKNGKQLIENKIQKKQQDVVLNEQSFSDRSFDIATCKAEIADLVKELEPYEKYPQVLLKTVPIALFLLCIGSAFLMLSYG